MAESGRSAGAVGWLAGRDEYGRSLACFRD
jgi:hypothetical protein